MTMRHLWIRLFDGCELVALVPEPVARSNSLAGSPKR